MTSMSSIVAVKACAGSCQKRRTGGAKRCVGRSQFKRRAGAVEIETVGRLVAVSIDAGDVASCSTMAQGRV